MYNFLKNTIKKQGPISLDTFINIALYNKRKGYYMKKVPIGSRGDFITSPEISQLFGEIIFLWIFDSWQKLKTPKDFILVELGPGKGTLMEDILRTSKKFVNFYSAMDIYLIEISPILREAQTQKLSKFQEKNIYWIDSIDKLPDKPMFIVANEFFDSLPIQQFVRIDKMWYENYITYTKNEFQVCQKPSSNISTLTANNTLIETCKIGESFIKKLESKIIENTGSALIIDYGYIAPPNCSTIQAVKDHAYHNYLRDVGNCDITAHVNFDALIRSLSLLNPIFTNQQNFLYNFGIKERLDLLLKISSQPQKNSLISQFSRLTRDMGKLFKVMIINSQYRKI